MWIVPQELEDAVLAATRSVVGEDALAPTALHRAVIDRSERYTSDRDRLAKPLDRKADLAARAAFFTIADAIKIRIPIAELNHRDALPQRRLRVVDLGAGCGALGLGLAAANLELDYTAYDRDADALTIAAKAFRTYAPASAITTRGCDVTKEPIPPADLVVMGTLLNELPPAARVPLVERALAAIGDDGAVIIIEPALRETSRALHELRDAITAHIFAPCTRQAKPCPMLANPDDWCHEDRLVRLPAHTAEVARVTHLRDSGLKFSYLVLRKAPSPFDGYRIVAEPVAPKGRTELLGCSDRGHTPIRLLKRNRSDDNRAVERARRGNVLVTADQRGEEDPRLELTGAAAIIDPSAAT